ncbi:baseplate J/gp47 family protein [Veillonella sp. CNR 79/14]|jgi:baseplate J-like protein|uniref:baseplate J/gp47 family protein n=1 Tax=Veillonella sp. CNR 79/14 TaxID=2490954 RepID=UPI000F8C44B3|nr:baseplate J/gp47 family protein [Veillonella sp. CNR 79/14]DAT29597.1 MAG TPA: Baseplate J like protein [Caudoviricetes sp.]
MFKIPNSDEILKELQNQCTSPFSKFEGTFEYDVFSSNAIEFMKTYVELGELYKVAFGDTAYGDFLTRKAADSGVIRKESTKAVGFVTVKGNGELPKGSQFATQTGVLFETLEAVTVDTQATVKVEAVIPGSIGNVTAQAISVIPMSIPGMLSVSNVEPMQDGFEAETDEELRTRYLNHVRNPGTSGNVNHYYEWAMSVAGVGGAKVIPTWNGPGTVKVIVVDTEYKAASKDIVAKVQSYVDKVRPMGAVVTVKTVEPTTINLSIHPEGAFSKDVFKELVKAYFIALEQQVIKGNQTVKLSVAKIGSLALDAGAIDYTRLLVNGRTESITLGVDQLAVLGEVQVV